jgi:hypothetical protein
VCATCTACLILLDLIILIIFQFHFPWLRSFIQSINQSRRPFMTLKSKIILYGVGLLGPHQSSELEDHPLSAVCSCSPCMEAASPSGK